MNQPVTVYRRDYQVPDFTITDVDLCFELSPAFTTVTSTLRIKRLGAADAVLQLDGEGLELVSLALDGTALNSDDYSCSDTGLTVHQLPDNCELQTVVRIKPQDNLSLSGLYMSSGNYCTQCEAMGFRHITYYLDRPDVMARFSCKIIADKAGFPVLLSNGNRVATEDLADGRHAVSWVDPFPKPAYLFALVAGKLEAHRGSFTTMSGRDIALEIWVEAQNIDKCEHALISLQKSMQWDEEVFGREYDLDLYMIVAVNDFNMGAMENKGLNIFNSKYVLAKPETATDDDYEHVEGVIAHEYFHNWTGNRVTCRDWFQLTLKEGLTVLRDQQFTADMTSHLVKRIDDVRSLRLAQFVEDAGPMSHPIRPDSYISMDNFYTATVYNKGAEIIRMYHTMLGADGFRKGMDLYFERHDGQAVTCDDFRAAMADANNVNLDQFSRWYQQRGTPTLTVTTDYSAADKTFTIHVQQSIPALKPDEEQHLPLSMPIVFGLLGSDGADMSFALSDAGPVATSHIYQCEQISSSVVITNIAEKPVLSLGRGFSAPVHIDYEQSTEELIFLMAHDSDGFNRWQAAQNLATHYLLAAIGKLQAGQSPATLTWSADYLDAFAAVLRDDRIDGSFKSLLLQLPSEIELAQALSIIDVDAIHAARESLRAALLDAHREEMGRIYASLAVAQEFKADRASIQARRLKNTLLAYLSVERTDAVLALAYEQFSSATNMTDAQAALSCLAQYPSEQSAIALQAFYDRWESDPLVMDKWFSVQALAKDPQCLERVRALCEHKQFNWTNPNRVRSLVAVFCLSNQLCFHALDGSAYTFLCEVVSRVQAQNPQLAARLVKGFNQWKRFDETRQQLQIAALKKIAALDGLSKDVYEIVHRALADA